MYMPCSRCGAEPGIDCNCGKANEMAMEKKKRSYPAASDATIDGMPHSKSLDVDIKVIARIEVATVADASDALEAIRADAYRMADEHAPSAKGTYEFEADGLKFIIGVSKT